MHISDSAVEKLLRGSKHVTAKQLNDLKKLKLKIKKPLQDLVIDGNLISEEDLTKLYGQDIKVPLAKFPIAKIKSEVLMLLPSRVARAQGAVVFKLDKDGTAFVAMSDPTNETSVKFLEKQLGRKLKIHLISLSTLQAAQEQYESLEDTQTPSHNAAPKKQVSDIDFNDDSAAAKTVNILIENAASLGVIDIHIEPREDFVVIRFRIDGLLRQVGKLPLTALPPLTGRLKSLANLSVDQSKAPQDGSLTTSLGKKNLILHVSTMPTLDGERIVVKIHDQSPKTADLKELGLWGKSLSDLKHAIVQPHGMIIVTGPVRSGKSTTLLSILNTLSLPGNSIATIEDPIKYRINSATQVQVNENLGVSYSSGLAALLGQNSNIIMVGDLVDLTTARLAILAASSGRLLLTTLPAYSAARGLELLANMGVEPYLTASTTRVIVSQRLLRRLCPICRESFVPSKSNLSYIATAFNIAAVGGMERINQLESEALNENVGRAAQASSNLSSEPDTINRLWRARRYGCDNCDHSGYKGLTAIYEVMPLTRDIQAQVASNKSGSAINDMVINQGMVPLQIDALIKALRGETTIEEILRVLAHGPARRQALA